MSIGVLQKDETNQRKIIFAINQAINWINTHGGGGGGGSGDGVGGRLTLVSGNPVMSNILCPGITSDTIYFTPYKGQSAPVWSGTSWSLTDYGGELSQALSDATKSPAAAVVDTLYDMFVWQDGSTMRCTRGPAWSSYTTRSAALAVSDGFLVNAADVTHGPKAGIGVYVGTIKVGTGAVACAFHPPGSGADGFGFGELDLWNYYNRIKFAGMVQEEGAWTWASTSWRMAGGFSAFIFYYVCGIDEDFVCGRYDVHVINFSGLGYDVGYAGIGVDSTTVPTGVTIGSGSTASTDQNEGEASGVFAGNPGIGFHYLAALESTIAATGQVEFFGGARGALMVDWKF